MRGSDRHPRPSPPQTLDLQPSTFNLPARATIGAPRWPGEDHRRERCDRCPGHPAGPWRARQDERGGGPFTRTHKGESMVAESARAAQTVEVDGVDGVNRGDGAVASEVAGAHAEAYGETERAALEH